MNNSARLFLSIALLSAFAALAPAQRKACPVPPPSPYKHNGTIVTSFDRTTRGMRTTLTHPQIIGNAGDSIYLMASFVHQRANSSSRLAVEVAFVSVSKFPKYRDSHNLLLLADGKQVPMVGAAAQYQAEKQEHGMTSEATKVTLPYSALMNLLRARRVDARLGTTQFELSNNHLEALRELASLMAPPPPSFTGGY
jgi:hypothetical protein